MFVYFVLHSRLLVPALTTPALHFSNRRIMASGETNAAQPSWPHAQTRTFTRHQLSLGFAPTAAIAIDAHEVVATWRNGARNPFLKRNPVS